MMIKKYFSALEIYDSLWVFSELVAIIMEPLLVRTIVAGADFLRWPGGGCLISRWSVGGEDEATPMINGVVTDNVLVHGSNTHVDFLQRNQVKKFHVFLHR